MSIAAITTNSFPYDILKLMSDGINWGIFEICFSAAVKSKGKWFHFSGSELCPSPSSLDSVIDWDKAKLSAYNLLLQKKLTPIDSKPFWAANQKSFSTTAKGELIIDTPLGTTSSNLHLTKVLYSLEVLHPYLY